MHAPNCNQNECFVVEGKGQETNTGGKDKMADHYRCTIPCAFCGRRKYYRDEYYHKQRLSANLKREARNGGGGTGGRSNGGNCKGTSQRRGKGQDQAQGKGGKRGGADRKNQDNNKDRNQDTSRGSSIPTPGGTNPEPSGGQLSPGPTTHSQTQAQQKEGSKCASEDGDELRARKRSLFMRMAQKMRKKGFDVTCPAEF